MVSVVNYCLKFSLRKYSYCSSKQLLYKALLIPSCWIHIAKNELIRKERMFIGPQPRPISNILISFTNYKKYIIKFANTYIHIYIFVNYLTKYNFWINQNYVPLHPTDLWCNKRIKETDKLINSVLQPALQLCTHIYYIQCKYACVRVEKPHCSWTACISAADAISHLQATRWTSQAWKRWKGFHSQSIADRHHTILAVNAFLLLLLSLVSFC